MDKNKVLIAVALVICVIVVVAGYLQYKKAERDLAYTQAYLDAVKAESKLTPFPANAETSSTTCISDAAAVAAGYRNANAAAEYSCKTLGKTGAWGVIDYACTNPAGQTGQKYKCL